MNTSLNRGLMATSSDDGPAGGELWRMATGAGSVLVVMIAALSGIAAWNAVSASADGAVAVRPGELRRLYDVGMNAHDLAIRIDALAKVPSSQSIVDEIAQSAEQVLRSGTAQGPAGGAAPSLQANLAPAFEAVRTATAAIVDKGAPIDARRIETAKTAVSGLYFGLRDHVRGVEQGLELQTAVTDGFQSRLVTGMAGIAGLAAALIAVLLAIIHQLRTRVAWLSRQRGVDVVTGLESRGSFEADLATLSERGRLSELPVAIVVVDVDGFRQINERHGRHAADEVLRHVAQRLAKGFADGRVARWGADEFIIALPFSGAEEAVRSEIALTLDRVNGEVLVAGEPILVRVTGGASVWRRDTADLAEAQRFAEVALDRAKSRQAGRLQFFDSDLAVEVARSSRLDDAIRRAVAERSFELVWQPQIDLATGRMASAEALLRWRDPRRSALVSAAEFIPAAERMGLILEIDRFVLDRALRMAARWSRVMADPPRVAVNISATHFCTGDLVGEVEQALARHGVAADRLEIELTESILLCHDGPAAETLNRLAAIGVRLALDDFGTGYSNIAYLEKLRPDAIKIDRSFVIGLETNPRLRSLVRSMIGLSRSLGMSVVAEGVETDEQLDFLKTAGCDLVQGYFIAYPQCAEDLEAWASHHDPRAFARSTGQDADVHWAPVSLTGT